MPISIQSESDGGILAVHLSGKLAADDYTQFVPAVNEAIQRHGKLRMLVEMQDFHGWTAGAVWEDTKFGFSHFNDIERLAIVGNRNWQQWMAAFCRPFTRAAVRYFPEEQLAEARQWLLAQDVGQKTAYAAHTAI